MAHVRGCLDLPAHKSPQNLKETSCIRQTLLETVLMVQFAADTPEKCGTNPDTIVLTKITSSSG